MSGFYSNLNKNVIKYLENIQLQHTNKFELIIYPGILTNDPEAPENDIAMDNIKNAFMTIYGNFAAKVMLQEFTIPFNEFEMGETQMYKYIKDIKQPTTFDAVFIDDERGLALRFIDFWRSIAYTEEVSTRTRDALKALHEPKEDQVQGAAAKALKAIKNPSNILPNTSFSPTIRRGIIFNSNQELAKMNFLLKVIGLQDDKSFLPFGGYPPISFRGVIPIKIGDIKLSQESADHMLINVTFSVDSIEVVTY